MRFMGKPKTKMYVLYNMEITTFILLLIAGLQGQNSNSEWLICNIVV